MTEIVLVSLTLAGVLLLATRRVPAVALAAVVATGLVTGVWWLAALGAATITVDRWKQEK